VSEQKVVATSIPKWRVVGVCELAPSGVSLRIEVEPESSIFTERYYANAKDVEAVINKRKKTATIYILEENEQKE